MTAPLRRYTPEEYLAFERAAESKHEYLDGQIFAMSGARRAHVALEVNVTTALRTRLRGGPCHTFTANMRVRSGTSRLYTYPDASALCGEPQFADDEFDVLLNPSVVVEILSDSTAAYDRGEKFAHYQTIATLRDYVLVSARAVRVEQFTRGAGGVWTPTVLAGRDAVLDLRAVGCRIPLAELYEDVDLSPPPPRPRVVREPVALYPAAPVEGAATDPALATTGAMEDAA